MSSFNIEGTPDFSAIAYHLVQIVAVFDCDVYTAQAKKPLAISETDSELGGPTGRPLAGMWKQMGKEARLICRLCLIKWQRNAAIPSSLPSTVVLSKNSY